ISPTLLRSPARRMHRPFLSSGSQWMPFRQTQVENAFTGSAAQRPSLPIHLQSHLHLAWRIRLAGDQAKRGAIQVCGSRAKDCPVENIKGFGPQIDAQRLAYKEALRQAYVFVLGPERSHLRVVAGLVAEGGGGLRRECGLGFEKMVHVGIELVACNGP